MKKIVLITLVLAFITSCGSKDKGELVGVKGKKWHPEKALWNEFDTWGRFCNGEI